MTTFTKEEKERMNEEQFQCAIDGFYGRTRICKICKTPTEFDVKFGRYCPNGCFKGNNVLKQINEGLK